MEIEKRDNPLRILLVGASGHMGTGYGLLSRYIGSRLNKRKDMKVYQLGLQTFGEINTSYGYDILSIGDDPHGSDILENYIQMFGINVLISFVDIWLPGFHYINQIVKKTGIKWICHLTVNAKPISPYLVGQAVNADVNVVPSTFGEVEAKKGGVPNVKMIYHGIDTDVFKPLSDEDQLQIKKDMGVENKFVFLAVGRNQLMQKAYPNLFSAYKIFLENEPSAKDNTILHCHCNPTENGGYDLKNLANRFGVTENVYYTIGHKSNWTLPPNQMAELYNYADCYLTTSHAESVCLPEMESMACSKPVIVPDFSAMPEWVNESGAGKVARIKALWVTALMEDNCLVDEVDFAKKMMELYNDRKLCKEMGKKGYDYIRSKFNWDKHIMPQWVKIIKRFDLEDYSDKPLVSVMMLSHNRQQWLKPAIMSVLNQTYKHFELIILDNGSTDGSVEIIEEYAKKDERITFIKNEKNLGCPAGRNQVLKECKGKYLIFNDDDDVSFPDRLARSVQFMEDNPGVAAVVGDSQIIDGESKIHPNAVHIGQDLVITFEMMTREHCVNSPTGCIDIEKLREVGGFQNDLDIASDRDMWMKLLQKYPILHKNYCLMQYRVHGQNISIKDPEKRDKFVEKILEKRIKARDDGK